jgi:hypothetical protein
MASRLCIYVTLFAVRIRFHGLHRVFPQSSNRDCEHSITERDRRFAVVEHHTRNELFASSVSEFSQPPEVRSSDRRRRFDLNTGQLTPGSFHHNIYLGTVAIAKVEKGSRLVAPARVSTQFAKDERLQQLP